VGYRRDASVGPVVVVAAGGVMTEVYRDRSVRLAPVTLPEATAMIGELRYRAVLAGFRGRPRGDVTALAETLVAVSRLAAREEVLACEINPLIVGQEGAGVHAVDAVAVVRQPTAARETAREHAGSDNRKGQDGRDSGAGDGEGGPGCGPHRRTPAH
jgi:succinyl-CoA synthetase beta subunit